MINYIDMETNTCIFGYGCIGIQACMNNIQFSEIHPSADIGSSLYNKEGIKIGDWEYTGNKVIIHFDNINETKSFSESLKIIEDKCGGVFEFKNIILDFTKYRQESIEVMKKHIKIVKNSLLMLMAC